MSVVLLWSHIDREFHIWSPFLYPFYTSRETNASIFTSLIWNIWKDKNNECIEKTQTLPNVIAKNAWRLALEIKTSFQDTLIMNDHVSPNLIRWSFPPVGWLKMNVDGSSRGNLGPAVFGGLVRNDQENWKIGFYGKLNNCSSLQVELWAIFRGLQLI